jgi:ankyrin repeat protein/beta-lactamase regulating signal transducer with metallopeptidase domain
MMRELFLRDLSLWDCLWQSLAFLALGLAAGWWLRRHPSRAYQALLLGMIAAVLVPFLSAVVRHGHLGVFPAAPETPAHELLAPLEPMAQRAAAVRPAPDVSRSVTSAGPQRSPAAPASIPWRAVLLSAWLAATLLLIARLVVMFVYGARVVRQAQRSGCEGIQQVAERTASRLRLAHGLQIRASDRIHSPVVWCWTHPPVLLVPRALGRPDVDWMGVVAHELAHCRRRDHLTGLVAELMVSLLPWNPLIWLARRSLIRLGEQACDDWVVAFGQSSEDYAESLLRFRAQRQMAFWPAVVSSQGGLAHRVRRILNDACGNPHAGVKWALALSMAALGIGIGVAFAQTRPAASEAQAQSKGEPSLSLHQAAATGDKGQVEKLLAQGADLNEKDKDGSTPLHEAAGNGWRDVARLLLEKGANVEAADASGQTPLHRASRFGSRHICALLLAKGASVNARDSRGNTVLHAALGRQEVDRNLFELLLAKGADVKARNEQGETPLHLACRARRPATYTQQREEAADVLLAHGAEVDATDKSGRTPLHVAVENGQDKAVGLLLAKGAAVEAKNAAGATALHVAATYRHSSDIVESLLNRGADVNSVDSEGQTPLHYAARRGDNETTVERLLIAKGADVNAKAAHGQTPAHLAAMMNHRDTVTFLLSKGADISSIQLAAYLGDLARVKGFLENGVGVNTQDAYSVTPLHAAAQNGQKEVAEFLLSKGASVNLASADSIIPSGTTPLHGAALIGSREVVELLIGKGAEIDAKDKMGITPLYYAARWASSDTARLLIAHGADVNAMSQADGTPLHSAAHYGNKDLVLLLLDHGADINAQNAYGTMPSELAAWQGHEDVVRLLIDKGADLSNRDVLLLCACKNQQRDLAELLIRKGANVNSKAWEGAPALQAIWFGYKTPDIPKLIGILKLLLDNGANPNPTDGDWYLLHYAAQDAEVTRVLLDKGANPNVIDKTGGQSPLHVSAAKGCKPAVELLVARGADPNLKDYDGRTPLALAREKGHNEIVEFLQQHGAKE